MIRVYTKKRHIYKIKKFLSENNCDFKIYTIKDIPPLEKFDLGVSYCYPRKITQPILSIPSKGFVNYHPAPLPKYKGPTELEDAIKNKEINWGVTVHYMDEDFDTGPIIKIKNIDLHEPPVSQQELGSISHYFLFQLFKETIFDIYNKKMKGILQKDFKIND
jgi:methionyl-tRNA formyltransferase